MVGSGAYVRPRSHVRLLVTGANYRRHRALGLPGFNAQALEQGRPGKIRGGAYAVIEDPDGPIRRQIARWVDDLVARMPTPGEAIDLSLQPGVPVVRVLRTVYDSEGRPVEVQDSVVAADRHEFRYEEQMR